MFRKTIKYAAIIFTLLLSLASCKKEDDIKSEKSRKALNGVIEQLVDEPFLHHKSYVTKQSWVYYNYVMPDYSEPIGWIYTIKIHNEDWSIAQEWTVQDLYLGTETYYSEQYSNYALTFYDALDFATSLRNDANGLISAGFRIPTDVDYTSDLTKLKSLLGSYSAIRGFLNLEYPVFYENPNYLSQFEDDATMYLDTRNCVFQYQYGSIFCWDDVEYESENDYPQLNGASYYLHPNHYSFSAKIRCVRNITQSQW